jgi:hypothetical protein
VPHNCTRCGKHRYIFPVINIGPYKLESSDISNRFHPIYSDQMLVSIYTHVEMRVLLSNACRFCPYPAVVCSDLLPRYILLYTSSMKPCTSSRHSFDYLRGKLCYVAFQPIYVYNSFCRLRPTLFSSGMTD